MDRNTEVELARQLIAGEPQAFDRFVEHFRAKIFHYSWLMCGQREDAEEVAQETLFKVFENFDRLEDPAHVRPWVYQIAKNACLMMRRKSVFAPERELSLDAPHGCELHIADSSPPPDRLLLQSELRYALDHAIRALPEIYRPVILLRDVEELSTAETARILDLTEDVVKTRLHRGRLALRSELQDYLTAARPFPPSETPQPLSHHARTRLLETYRKFDTRG